MIFSSAPNDWLMHHGIKGQKWGIRRYQNPDGTLTAEGRRRYDNMSDRKLAKTLKKQIRNQRKIMYGSGNQWNTGLSIGKHSKEFDDAREKARERYESTPEYKEWHRKVERLANKMESGTLHDEQIYEYDKKWQQLMKEAPKPDKKDAELLKPIYKTVGQSYTKEVTNVLEKRTVAQLKDLGYSSETSQELVNRLVKSNNIIWA